MDNKQIVIAVIAFMIASNAAIAMVPQRRRVHLLGVIVLIGAVIEYRQRTAKQPEVRKAAKRFPVDTTKFTPGDKDAVKRLMQKYKVVVEQYLNDKLELALRLNAKLMLEAPEGTQFAANMRKLQTLIETAISYDVDDDRKKFIEQSLAGVNDWRQHNGMPKLVE